MKKIILIIIASFLLSFVLSACGGKISSIDDNEVLSVVATIFAPYDFAREIAGEKADITMLLPPASESHSYEPTPQDIIKIQNCDVFIYVGGDSDEWVRGVLDSIDTAGIKIITLMDCVDVVEEEIVEGMEHNHDHDVDEHDHDNEKHYHDDNEHDHDENEHDENEHNHEAEAEYDEHVWTSPKNAKIIIQKISDALCAADTINSDFYTANTKAYLQKLNDLDAAFKDVVDNASRKTLIFGDRFPFRYLADAYGLEYYAAFPGCSTESEPSAKTVIFLIDKIKAEGIPVVFHIELSNMKMANTISEATGAKVLQLHACHNISRDDFLTGVSYLDLMNQNVVALKEALQ